MKAAKWILVLALFALTASPAWAGWEIKYQSTGRTGLQTIYVQDNMMRQEMGKFYSIMDVNKQWLYFVNPAKTKYWAGPIDQFGGKTRRVMDQRVRRMLKKLPPDQRQAAMKAMAKQEGNGAGGPAGPQPIFTVKDAGKTAEVAGYKCRLYQVLSDGKNLMDLWIAPQVKIYQEIDSRKMVDMMAKMSQSFRRGMGGRDKGPLSSPEVQALWSKGYPLKQVRFSSGGSRTSQASSAREKDLSPDLFKPPEGYTKVDSMMEMMR